MDGESVGGRRGGGGRGGRRGLPINGMRVLCKGTRILCTRIDVPVQWDARPLLKNERPLHKDRHTSQGSTSRATK